MTGTYVTLVSGLIALFGWDMLLLAAGTDQVRFGELANRYASWMQQYYDALAETDVPVVMMHDDIVWASGPIFRPAWYREYVFPNYERTVRRCWRAASGSCFVRTAISTPFVDDMAGVGLHGFVFEPLTDLESIVERYGQTHVIVGNADTRVLLSAPSDRSEPRSSGACRWGATVPAFLWRWGTTSRPIRRSRTRCTTTRCTGSCAGGSSFCRICRCETGRYSWTGLFFVQSQDSCVSGGADGSRRARDVWSD